MAHSVFSDPFQMIIPAVFSIGLRVKNPVASALEICENPAMDNNIKQKNTICFFIVFGLRFESTKNIDQYKTLNLIVFSIPRRALITSVSYFLLMSVIT